MYYLLFFISVFFLSLFLTWVIKKIAIRLGVVDRPKAGRKIHKNEVPLLGGLAVFFSFFIVLFFAQDRILAGDLEINHWFGLFVGACFLMIGGFLDDKYNLKPKYQIIFPILAALAIIAGGVNIEKITNPFGGFWNLGAISLPVISWDGQMHYFIVISDMLIIFWLMGMMYTTKLLDGLDGLVTGVTAIGAIIIFLFTMTDKYNQPDIAVAALILAGACLGFLVFNWHPARIFLGEGGSLLLGFILGVLAIISGGKIAIALLIMGLPILDVAWTIIRRLMSGKNPFKFSDKKHLHFRLFALGIGQRKTVLIYYFFSAFFGLSALFLQSLGKLLALVALILIMAGFITSFNYLDKKQPHKEKIR
ncbi:MAG: MraY family glycosyltransferase [Patescibacteria group bacterium]|nr:MraY family glycosyltransferase [Patescibacteria group bacterium]